MSWGASQEINDVACSRYILNFGVNPYESHALFVPLVWDPAKGWNAAVEASAAFKEAGLKVVLLARGGIEPYGEEVIHKARSLGLRVTEAWAEGAARESYFSAIARASEGDVVNVRSHLLLDFLRVLYRGSHAVLANSAREPFGLVGLEAMASGGVTLTGATPTSAVTRLEGGSPKRTVYTTILESSSAGAGITPASGAGPPGVWSAGRCSDCG